MDQKRLPPELLPELRARWMKYVGAREVVAHAAEAMRRCETQYQDNLNLALRVLGLDPATNWKINLETGEVDEVTAADVAVQAQHGSVPFVAPTVDGQN